MSKVLNLVDPNEPDERADYDLHVWSSVNVVVEAIQNNQIDPEDVLRVLSAIEQRSKGIEVHVSV
jgi:uncharacterized membrane protein YjjP (DUF1212 family)